MTTKHQTFQMAPQDLLPNPWNSNVVGPEMEARIDASIQQLDFFKPIIVRELGDDRFEILGGEHRVRSAIRLGRKTIPCYSVGVITDTQAKAIGVADNAQYGEDDALKLAGILRDIGEIAAIETFLPFTDKDLAGIFATESMSFDDFNIDPDDTDKGAEDLQSLVKERPAATHDLMRFKVPIADRERVQKFIEMVIKTSGLAGEQDSLVAAGMALVQIVNAAKETM